MDAIGTYIVCSFIITLFLNRWLNILMVKKWPTENHIAPILWFVNIIGTVILLLIYALNYLIAWDEKQSKIVDRKETSFEKLINWFFYQDK